MRQLFLWLPHGQNVQLKQKTKYLTKTPIFPKLQCTREVSRTTANITTPHSASLTYQRTAKLNGEAANDKV